ncbi:MAG: HTTM domain-containing protein [Flavobacteriales bacterium]|nr:HTTM domain-containing protein [Flavobacteriales bacterium]
MTEIRSIFNDIVFRKTSNAPLVVFRILFGLIVTFSILRFAYYGWIDEQYVSPRFFFTYLGFDWIKPLSASGMYWIFGLMAFSGLLIAFGLFYRMAIISFFVLFTYVELIDKTNYLNHYYFISLVSFILIFLPLNRRLSLDAKFGLVQRTNQTSNWAPLLIKLQIAVLYFFAGVAKLQYEWLIEAQPLATWLPAKSGLPIVGSFLDSKVTAYLFSWTGAFFDLTVAFFLFWKRTRIWAYTAVVAFHISTWILFPIGMFPFFMIGMTLIFFDHNYLDRLSQNFSEFSSNTSRVKRNIISLSLITYLLIQVFLPVRFLLYPGKLFWNEEAYRFSWRVMLMEKSGYVNFTVIDALNPNLKEEVSNDEHLTLNQVKMMATQPDMIVQFAQYLKGHYKQKGMLQPEVYAYSYASLNGKGSQPFIDPNVNLAEVSLGFGHRDYVLPYPYK